MVYQALPGEQEKEFQKRIGWLFLWQFEYLSLSVVLMFVLLATLILIYLRLGIGRSTVTMHERLAVQVPFSVYLGWITIASIANAAVTLVSIKWDGFGVSTEAWVTPIIIVALLITILVAATRKDVTYALIIIWALLGIASKQSGNQTIVTLTEISAAIVLVALAATILLTNLQRRQVRAGPAQGSS